MTTTIFHAVNLFDADGIRTDWQFQFDGVSPDNASGTTPYLYPADVKAQELYTDENGDPQVIDRAGTLIQANEFRITGAPVALGRQVRIYRATEVRFPLVDYRDRQVVSEFDLDLQARQTLFVAMEVADAAAQSVNESTAAVATANDVLIVANEAKAQAELADTQSQTAISTANSASSVANSANTKSDSALADAAAALAAAAAVEDLAQAAADAAVAAGDSAAVAEAAALQAVTVSSAVDGKAQQALENSLAAITTADEARIAAESIAGNASDALAAATEALDTANEAKATADAVDGKAQQALDDSASALSTVTALAGDVAGKIDSVTNTTTGPGRLVKSESPANTVPIKGIATGSADLTITSATDTVILDVAPLRTDVNANTASINNLTPRVAELETRGTNIVTEVDATGLATIDFPASIPAWATVIRVHFRAVGVTTTSIPTINLRHSAIGPPQGYVTRSSLLTSAVTSVVGSTLRVDLSTVNVPTASRQTGTVEFRVMRNTPGTLPVYVISGTLGDITPAHRIVTGHVSIPSTTGFVNGLYVSNSVGGNFTTGFIGVSYE